MKLAQGLVNLNFKAEKSVRLLEIESVAEVEPAPSWSQFSRGRWIAVEESIQPNITSNSLFLPLLLIIITWPSGVFKNKITENKWKYIYDTLSQPPCNVQLADPWYWGWPANWQWVGLLTHRACGQQLTPPPRPLCHIHRPLTASTYIPQSWPPYLSHIGAVHTILQSHYTYPYY